jgi:hypothetical protein
MGTDDKDCHGSAASGGGFKCECFAVDIQALWMCWKINLLSLISSTPPAFTDASK